AAPVDVVAGARRGSALDRWLRNRLEAADRGVRLERLREAPQGTGRDAVLIGPGGPRGLTRETLPPGFPGEFGHALEHVWRLHQRTLRLEVINQVTSLTAGTLALPRVYEKVAEAVRRLIDFDALGVTLLDRERGEFRLFDVTTRTA